MRPFDTTTRFLFDRSAIRGELTLIDQTLKDVLSKHGYPKSIQKLLGEFMAAAAMLSDTLKFDGTLSLQVRGSGQVRLLLAECTNNSDLRAIAQYNDDFVDDGDLLGDGQMAITIEPKQGQRYQGIVTISDTELPLAAALEDYFLHSEQIRTRIWLFSDHQRAAGLMLQAMPKSASESSLADHDDDDSWDRTVHLASTLKAEEALSLDTNTLLHRLYHEEEVRVYDPHSLQFECSCSEERSANAIITLGMEEAVQLVKELGHLDIDCQFCRERYVFSEQAVIDLFHSRNGDSTIN